jgi:hypothetical protein
MTPSGTRGVLTDASPGGASGRRSRQREGWSECERTSRNRGLARGFTGRREVPRRVFQRLLLERPTPERCVEAYYLQRARFESIAALSRVETDSSRPRSSTGTSPHPALSFMSATALPTPARFRPLGPPMFDSPTIAS